MRKFWTVSLSIAALAFASAASCGSASAVAPLTLNGEVTADDSFYIYISTSPSTLGTLIGTGDNWAQTYAIDPTGLEKGTTYYLNVVVNNLANIAGFIGSFSVGGENFVTDGSWKTAYVGTEGGGNNYPPTSWTAPTGSAFNEGSNGSPPPDGYWSAVLASYPNISSSAQWIWPNDNSSFPNMNPSVYDNATYYGGVCVGCTVEFQKEFTSPVPEPSTWAMMLLGFAGIGWAGYHKAKKAHSTAAA